MSLKDSKAERLSTIYAGKQAPGGCFYPATKHYIKKCKHVSAGRHPVTGDLGGIDIPVIEELKRRGCKTMQLELANGKNFYIPFEVFKDKCRIVKWRDARFPARAYCPEIFWTTSEEGLANLLKTQEETNNSVQISLFA